jgi:hypothetical protein
MPHHLLVWTTCVQGAGHAALRCAETAAKTGRMAPRLGVTFRY